MNIYLVGGAVRDELLKLPIKEWDWVVVGATPEDMLAHGYQPVGKDFPVFLHPKTKEEYALARTERKTGHGYKGFSTSATPEVTLEQDLSRRDLTINAMAQDAQGEIIDPYGGRVDLAEGVLRHVSAAFVEDPVRVLRTARFMAKLAHLGFTVASETCDLMRQMAISELDHLVPERVWQELQKALGEHNPEQFFITLDACGALKKIFPEISQAFNADNMESLHRAAKMTPDPKIRFAAYMQFLPADLVERRCQHFHIPTEYAGLAIICAKYREAYQHSLTATPEELLQLLNNVDVWRKPQRFAEFLTACAANVHLHRTEEIEDHLLQAYAAAKSVNTESAIEKHRGKAVGEAIYQARLEAIAQSLMPLPLR